MYKYENSLVLTAYRFYIVFGFFLLFLMTEWELFHNGKYMLLPKEKNECEDALSNSLNDLLKQENMPDVHYDCITVTNKTLEIRFAMRNLSFNPNIDALSTIVKRCFDKHKLNKLTLKKERVVSR